MDAVCSYFCWVFTFMLCRSVFTSVTVRRCYACVYLYVCVCMYMCIYTYIYVYEYTYIRYSCVYLCATLFSMFCIMFVCSLSSMSGKK